MRYFYWAWLIIWFITWTGTTWMGIQAGGSVAFLFMMSAFGLGVLFFTSVVKYKQKMHFTLWLLFLVIITIAFILPSFSTLNPFVFLLFLLVLVSAAETFQKHYFWTIMILVFLLLTIFTYPYFSLFNGLIFCYIYVLIAIGLSIYQMNATRLRELELRYKTLLHTHRQLKRNSITQEKHIREQERVVIGREIHDRAGHSLTNLLMLIETFRLKNENDPKDWEQVKSLAQESLNETRQAVKALQNEQITGMSAVIQLIRKIEAEHFLSITFSMRQNALSVSLSPTQASVVYRCIQEALTNVMRHSDSKKAEIIFEAPGNSHFRLEVHNALSRPIQLTEGFGLKSMRKRLQAINGHLEVLAYDSQFIVRGSFPINQKDEEN
ncbi:sensor histidine kinase [Gracilibacillus dipsosauri]|uniref:histidine kinase n=1 Tax=Gracilibacillus dipsosauri TaxID=178340 RepID=A0A317L228_9BACI|nr:histidine kinase [Gracilibacillus dipsosauri]PWU69715.1 hypothetical protein DLJ74_01955 [Gracilibacillus dipsosauri]